MKTETAAPFPYLEKGAYWYTMPVTNTGVSISAAVSASIPFALSNTRRAFCVAGARVLLDIDDTIIEVHGYTKQGAGFGYSRVRGLNVLLATASTDTSAPVVVAQRLRKGACGSPRGAQWLVADALRTVARLATWRPVLLRADSAFHGRPTIGAALPA